MNTKNAKSELLYIQFYNCRIRILQLTFVIIVFNWKQKNENYLKNTNFTFVLAYSYKNGVYKIK